MNKICSCFQRANIIVEGIRQVKSYDCSTLSMFSRPGSTEVCGIFWAENGGRGTESLGFKDGISRDSAESFELMPFLVF